MKRHKRKLVALGVALLLATAAGAGELRVFGVDSMRAIERQYAGAPFIVAVWATDCPPCRHELALLGSFATDHPEVPVVLVATDPSDNAAAVTRVLESFSLPGVDTWRFGDAGAERLRYTIDPDWRGEMPRSYLYDGNGGRVGISGPVSEELLQRWIRGGGQ